MKIIIEQAGTINWEYIIAILTILGSTAAIIVNIILSKKQRTADIVTKNRMEWIQECRKIFKDYYAKVKIFEDKQAPEDCSEFLKELYLSESAIKLQLNCFGKFDDIIIKYVEEVNRSYDAFFHKTLLLKNNHDDRHKISKDMIEYIDKYNPEILDSVTSKTAKKYNLQDIINNKEYAKFADLMSSEEFLKESVNSLFKMEKEYIEECIKVIQYLPEIILIYIQVYLKVEWERVKEESEKGNIKDFDFETRFKTYIMEKQLDMDKYNNLLPNRVIK